MLRLGGFVEETALGVRAAGGWVKLCSTQTFESDLSLLERGPQYLKS